MSVKTERHQVLRMKLFGVQICSLDTEEEALVWTKGSVPCGTSHGWQKSEDPDHKPIKCADNKDRTHYVFIC